MAARCCGCYAGADPQPPTPNSRQNLAGQEQIQLTTPILLAHLALGAAAGAMVAVQSVLNSTLSARAGSLVALAAITLVTLIVLGSLALLLPDGGSAARLPGLEQGHLYLGGVLGAFILIAIVFLLPRVGTTVTLVSIVVGQLAMALLIDHYGLLASPQLPASLPRLAGIALVAVGTFLVAK